jgi:hypothetical protein
MQQAMDSNVPEMISPTLVAKDRKIVCIQTQPIVIHSLNAFHNPMDPVNLT